MYAGWPGIAAGPSSARAGPPLARMLFHFLLCDCAGPEQLIQHLTIMPPYGKMHKS